MRTILLAVLIVFAAGIFWGCDEENDELIYIYDEDVPPPVPQGVFSITGDEQVALFWLPIDDINRDFESYVVYRSDFPDTGYWEIGQTVQEQFVDNDVVNGRTYFYAVSSVDVDGNLSDLSYAYVFDTPRPQGTNALLYDYNVRPDSAGWDLSAAEAVHLIDGDCDFFLEYFENDGVFYFNVADDMTDIQDMGYTADFDEIGYSPEYGWSRNGWCEVILDHTYIIWTADNHFAKIRVTGVGESQVLFDWAYQVDPGNLELKPRVDHNENFLRHPQDEI